MPHKDSYEGADFIRPAGEKVKLKDYRNYGREKPKTPSVPTRLKQKLRTNPSDRFAQLKAIKRKIR